MATGKPISKDRPGSIRRGAARLGALLPGRHADRGALQELGAFKKNLGILRADWERRACAAESAVCTDETHAALMAERAKLRRVYAEADRRRRDLKERFLAPWAELTRVWDENVGDYYRWADTTYRKKIETYDEAARAALREELKDTYNRLQEELGIRWLPLDRALELSGLRITLGEKRHGSPEARRRALTLALEHVGVETAEIAGMDDAPAIMAEYMDCLSIPEAALRVSARRRREREARAALRRENGGQEIMDDVEFRVSGCTWEELERLRKYLIDRAIRFE